MEIKPVFSLSSFFEVSAWASLWWTRPGMRPRKATSELMAIWEMKHFLINNGHHHTAPISFRTWVTTPLSLALPAGQRQSIHFSLLSSSLSPPFFLLVYCLPVCPRATPSTTTAAMLTQLQLTHSLESKVLHNNNNILVLKSLHNVPLPTSWATKDDKLSSRRTIE